MRYDVLSTDFDAAEHARNKLIRCNQLEQSIVDSFVAVYEDFWGVSVVGPRYTSGQMQQIIDTIPAQVLTDILNGAAALLDFIATNYSRGLDVKYQSPAFNLSVSEGRLVVGTLKDTWAVK